MELRVKIRAKAKVVVECILILFWLLFLRDADSFYAPYLVVGLAGTCLCIHRYCSEPEALLSRKDYCLTEIFAIAMSCMVLLANYKCFILNGSELGNLKKLIDALLIFMGGYISFKEILLGLANWSGTENAPRHNCPKDKFIWVGMWAIIVAVDSFVLFMAVYPGVLTPDSISQMTQLLEGQYSNHHPYYHTQIIHFWINIGIWLFNDINAAVALYNCFSISIMALCFVYVVETVDKITGNRAISLMLFIWYLIMPFHITYSFTMWKDVFFGAVVTGLVVSVYRYLHEVGRQRINFIVIIIMSLGVCLLRSNGWVAFFLTVIAFTLLYRSKHRKLIITFVSILVVSFVMKHQVLGALNVSQPDTIEALSIPAQQIARVVVDGNELSEEQKELLEQVVDIERIPETYANYISDNIKKLVREKGNQDYIKTHKVEFIKLYFQLGIEHPKSYIKAWVDQTKGYWNSGYWYWRWYTGITENGLGIEQTVNSEAISGMLGVYLRLWEINPVLQLFLSIGLYTWIILLCAYNSIIKRNKATLLVAIPFLAVIATLIIATPVYSEFRYAYALFCGAPFVVIMSLSNSKKEKPSL